MTCTSADIDRFRHVISRRLGLHFDDGRHDVLTEVLEDRIRATASSAGGYLSELDCANGALDELRALAERLTIGETYFFRNIEQFHALAEVVVPDRVRACANERVLRVLSAGCSSGEEPYSIAMLMSTHLARSEGWRADVTAIDVDHAALSRARRARYSPWSLRETPADVRQRWFRTDGRELVLDDAIRASVRFEERNLVVEDSALWAEDKYDVVFFRNVVMYFTAEKAQAIIARIERSLAPGGFLFLGHAETLRGLSNGFSLCHSHGTFYYQRKARGSHGTLTTAGSDAHDVFPTPVVVVPEASTGWMESISRASAKIAGLSEASATTRNGRESATHGQVSERASKDVARSRELLRQERFVEALELIGTLPSESRETPEIMLLNAALLAQSGSLAESERLCTRLLGRDDLNAGAHYLLALCREGAGDPMRAIEHDESAIYLDPSFAMPRLHLALIHRRRGEMARARRGFDGAMALLHREDVARLLLFGGGFQRDALIALCRAEIARCGGGA